VGLLPVGPKRLGVLVFQDNEVTSPPVGSDPLRWQEYLLHTYADYPVWVRDAFSAMNDGDEVFADQILQVPAIRLVKGRVALLGDAGFCPTFLSGMGAGAALEGAYALSRQLAKYEEIDAGLAAYEALILPLAKAYQTSAIRSRSMMLARGYQYTLRSMAIATIPRWLIDAQWRKTFRTDVTMETLS
jgi:2-polyprenyl-6-methoxyphenol hydroxylase-like FAD-dependent oxidoreductase